MFSFFNNIKIGYYMIKGNYALYKSLDHGKALHYFENILKIDDDNVNGLLGKGKSLDQITFGIKGEEFINKALEINPNHIIGLTYKGDILEDKNDYEGAAKYFERALTIVDNSENSKERRFKYSICADLSFQYICMDDPQKAKKFLKIWIKEYPNNSRLLVHMGLVLNMLGEYNEAISYFDLAIENNNDLNDFYDLHHIGKAISLFHLNDYEKSLIWLDKAIEVRDNNPCSFYWKYKLLKKLGEDEKGDKCLSKSKELYFDKYNYYKGNKIIFK